MLFSLLSTRRKTTGLLVGILVGGLCLWAVAAWQQLSWQHMMAIGFATVVMLGSIMLAALLLVAGGKLGVVLLVRLGGKIRSMAGNIRNH